MANPTGQQSPPPFVPPVVREVAGLYHPQEKIKAKEVFLAILDKASRRISLEAEYDWALILAPNAEAINQNRYLEGKIKGVISLADWQAVNQAIPAGTDLRSAVEILGGKPVAGILAFVKQAKFGLAFHTGTVGRPVRLEWIQSPSFLLASLAATKVAQPEESLVGIMGAEEVVMINQQVAILMSKQGETEADIYDLRYTDLEEWSYHHTSRQSPNKTPDELADEGVEQDLEMLRGFQALAKSDTAQARYDAMREAPLFAGVTEQTIMDERDRIRDGIAKARAEELTA